MSIKMSTWQCKPKGNPNSDSRKSQSRAEFSGASRLFWVHCTLKRSRKLGPRKDNGWDSCLVFACFAISCSPFSTCCMWGRSGFSWTWGLFSGACLFTTLSTNATSSSTYCSCALPYSMELLMNWWVTKVTKKQDKQSKRLESSWTVSSTASWFTGSAWLSGPSKRVVESKGWMSQRPNWTRTWRTPPTSRRSKLEKWRITWTRRKSTTTKETKWIDLFSKDMITKEVNMTAPTTHELCCAKDK